MIAWHQFESADATDDPNKVDGPEWNKIHKGFVASTLLYPSAAINVLICRVPKAFTATNIRARRVGGTGATINVRKNGVSNLMSSHLSLAAADTWYVDAGLQNQTFAVGDLLEFMFVTLTGSPEQALIQLEF